LRCHGKPLPAALGELASPYAHGAIFGQAVLHGGDDLIGKRNLRIGCCGTIGGFGLVLERTGPLS
jgi:hypothetical protein